MKKKILLLSIFAMLLMLSTPVMSSMEVQQPVKNNEIQKSDGIAYFYLLGVSNIRKNGGLYTVDYMIGLTKTIMRGMTSPLKIYGMFDTTCFDQNDLNSPSSSRLDIFINLPFPYPGVVEFSRPVQ